MTTSRLAPLPKPPVSLSVRAARLASLHNLDIATLTERAVDHAVSMAGRLPYEERVTAALRLATQELTAR
jgi:hypothetical protein